MPQALFVTLSFVILLGRMPAPAKWRVTIATITMGFAVAVRPDALPMLAALCAFSLFQAIKERALHHLTGVILASLIVICYFGAHFLVFGDLFPNTFYLKVGLGPTSVLQGIRYAARSVLEISTPVLIGLFVVHVITRRRDLAIEWKVVAVAMLLQTAYIVMIGGDAFAAGRFFLLLAPISAMLASEIIIRSIFPGTTTVEAIASGSAVLFLPISAYLFYLDGARHDLAFYGNRKEAVSGNVLAAQVALTDKIRQNLRPEDGQIGLFYLGGPGYYLAEYRIADSSVKLIP